MKDHRNQNSYAFYTRSQIGGADPYLWEVMSQASPSGTSPSPEDRWYQDEFEYDDETTDLDETALNAVDVLARAQSMLGLNKTALAAICSVSRQTVYDWIHSRASPQASHIEKLRVLNNLSQLEALQDSPLAKRWARVPITTGDQSLQDYLTRPTDELDHALLHELIVTLIEHASKSEALVRSASARSIADAEDAHAAKLN